MVEKLANEFIDAANSVTKRFYHDGNRVIEEYDDAATPARLRYFVWGGYIDELLLVNDDAGGDSDYYACHNHLFSPEALIDDTGALEALPACDPDHALRVDAHGREVVDQIGRAHV